MRNILVAQSGGPTVAINASLTGVIRQGLESEEIGQVYGGCNGIQGILEDRLMNLTELFGGREDRLSRLKYTPAMFLGSCRYKMKPFEEDDTDYRKLQEIFDKYQIDAFFYIGGNDSMDTVLKLSAYAEQTGMTTRIIGIPKTIDNDLVQIDHTPGFGSAARYIATTVREIAMDTYIYNIDTVVIVEIMGRDAGWLTAASVMARSEHSPAPHLIYLPESVFDIDNFLQQVKKCLFRYHHVIVAVSEGIRDADGTYISADNGRLDKFGHVSLSGTGERLKEVVADRIGCKVRCVELNVAQRAAAHMASATDLEESEQLGRQGVRYALAGQTGVMSSLQRRAGKTYQIDYLPVKIDGIANAVRTVPEEWITPDETGVTAEMEQYLRPLIQGTPQIPYKDGLPDYLYEPNNLY